MSYQSEQRRCAIAWKQHTDALPDGAKAPAPYVGKGGRPGGPPLQFCVPAEFAAWNLLPDVRGDALALFAELGIPWHAGVGDGPGNHLLSSQVQCVNALARMVTDPDSVAFAFRDSVDVGELLEIEPGRYLTFEYIGPVDFFGEALGGERIRGARCTSVDAAFVHRASDGRRELVLVEWKYTETYGPRGPDPRRDQVRHGRYAAALANPDGPVRADLLTFAHLLDEPFYQLVRQQLLAHQLERAGVADRVRVVHVLPPANAAYQASLARPEHRALGGSVSEVWGRLLRRPDRFTTMDPSVFLTPVLTSREYVLRYAPDIVWNEAGLVDALGVADVDGVEDVLDWDGDLEYDDDGLYFRVGTSATGLCYPFRLRELHELVDELER
jgi:hypothetical protein